MRKSAEKACLSLGVVLAAAGLAGGGGILPDLAANPVTGFLESVDLHETCGGCVRHVEDPGQQGTRTSSLISSGTSEDPRLSVAGSGDTTIVWWVDGTTDEVRYAWRELDTGDWSDEATLSSSGEDSRHPEIVHDGSEAVIAYEIASAGTTEIAVVGATEVPEPFPTRTVVASTDFAGQVDVLPYAESGVVWVTWVDSATEVGWSQYDESTDAWTTPQYESYEGSTVLDARREIRDTVLGL